MQELKAYIKCFELQGTTDTALTLHWACISRRPRECRCLKYLQYHYGFEEYHCLIQCCIAKYLMRGAYIVPRHLFINSCGRSLYCLEREEKPCSLPVPDGRAAICLPPQGSPPRRHIAEGSPFAESCSGFTLAAGSSPGPSRSWAFLWSVGCMTWTLCFITREIPWDGKNLNNIAQQNGTVLHREAVPA